MRSGKEPEVRERHIEGAVPLAKVGDRARRPPRQSRFAFRDPDGTRHLGRIVHRRLITSATAMLAVAAAVSGCGGSGGSNSGTTKSLTQTQLVAQVAPSVVEISGKEGDLQVGGSGVVIDANRGLVLTNAHVIAGLASISAKVGDDPSSEGPARVVASSPCDDVAIVQLVNKPTNLRALPLGTSTGVASGQSVTAFGYPASFENPAQQTVVSTTGTVSSPNVPADPSPDLPHYVSTIQHQAPINPGNSGGPLVDQQGRLIGINTLGNTQQGGRTVQGQYYAISVDHIKQLLPALEAGTSQGDVGWDLVPVNEVDLAQQFATDPRWQDANLGAQVAKVALKPPQTTGLYVTGAATGSPADKANLGYGDLIDHIEGTPVQSVADVCSIVQSHGPGSTLFIHGQYLNSASTKSKIFKGWTDHVKLK
jgi:S1-C subfamily serine protease